MPELKQLLLSEVVPDPNQPRKYYDELALNELVQSISTDGVIQPILVRPTADGQYMIVCGERRYRASMLAGKQDIPAVVRDMNDNDALQLQIVENLLRKDVHPIEEATAFKSLAEKYSAEEIATRVGKSTAYVVKRIKLADLIPEAQDIYFRNLIEMKHAQMLCRLSPEEQKEVIDASATRNKKTNIIDDIYHFRIERGCESSMVTLDKAPFKTTDAKLYPEAGACTKCPHNTANSPLLFDDLKGKHCTKSVCFNIKVMRAEQAKLQEIIADPAKIVIVNSTYLDDREKVKVQAAKEMGVTILDNKLWEREYGAPDNEFQTWEEFLEDQCWEGDEPTEKELEEAQKEYAADKAAWEKDVAAYQEAVASGAIKEAYSLLDGRSIPIRLIGAGKQMLSEQSGDAGDASILSEIANIEQREARAKQLDAEKVWAKIHPLIHDEDVAKDLFSTHALREIEMTAAFHAMGDKISYEGRRLIVEFLGDNWQSYDGVTEYGLNQMMRIFMMDVLISSYGSHHVKGSKNQHAYNVLKQYIPGRISIIEQEQEEKAEKRQANVKKRIDALREKLTTTV